MYESTPVPSSSVPYLVQQLTQHCTAQWWESECTPPALGAALTARDQATREGHLERFLNVLTDQFKNPPRSSAERKATQERIFGAFAAFSQAALDFQQRHLDVILTSGFTEVATRFPEAARRFDPSVSGSDIFQASRNAWTMNGLQALLGLPVQLTPAMFAYSMLYPYTDNYLDDPAVPSETKAAFNARFAHRLQGESVEPTNAQERTVTELVGQIEATWSRAQYPQVHESLLAIHRAQCRSVNLLRRGASPYEVDVLGISLEKGGTSVLADGYLVAGDATPAQAEFFFGWGAFLQFVDDLQDVQEDARKGLLTIFSQTAERWPLDAITSRTFHFGERVLRHLACFDAPQAQAMKELIQKSATLLLVTAAGNAATLYSAPYLRELETHSPFRFAFLKKTRERLGQQRVSILRLIEAFATPLPA